MITSDDGMITSDDGMITSDDGTVTSDDGMLTPASTLLGVVMVANGDLSHSVNPTAIGRSTSDNLDVPCRKSDLVTLTSCCIVPATAVTVVVSVITT